MYVCTYTCVVLPLCFVHPKSPPISCSSAEDRGSSIISKRLRLLCSPGRSFASPSVRFQPRCRCLSQCLRKTKRSKHRQTSDTPQTNNGVNLLIFTCFIRHHVMQGCCALGPRFWILGIPGNEGPDLPPRHSKTGC